MGRPGQWGFSKQIRRCRSFVVRYGIRAGRSGDCSSVRSPTYGGAGGSPRDRVLDFHTVQGYPLYNAEGKPRSSNTVISPRWYLQDASFLVVLDLPDDWRER